MDGARGFAEDASFRNNRRSPSTSLRAGFRLRYAALRMTGLMGSSAAFFASGHDGGVEAFAEVGGKVVDLVGAIDFDGLAGGA